MATMSTRQPQKSVFVGNIPYGLTEEQIKDIFGSAGTVLNFRLVYDSETGKPKGYGFAEYPDIDSAASAVRNLNGYDIMNRQLKVDFSNEGDKSQHTNWHNNQNPNPPPQNGIPVPPPVILPQTTHLPALPLGTDLPANITCSDSISRTLNTLPPAQLLDVLSQMKSLVTADPGKATALLQQAPQLSYAIFQALMLMGLVSTDALKSVVDGTSATSAAAPPAAQVPVPGMAPTPVPGGPMPGYAPPPPQGYGQGGYGGTPQQGMPFQPPVPQRQAPMQQAPAPAPAPPQNETEALMQQVLAMPQAIIDQLPPAERAQVMALRQQFMGAR